MTQSSSVSAKLHYHFDDGKRPYLYARKRTAKDPHSMDYGGSPDLVTVQIKNGRQSNLTLDENAFELVTHPTSLAKEDFVSNKAKVEQVYYKEVEEMIRQKTGASVVWCFHHQTRNGARNQYSSSQYATDVHTDTSPSDAEKTFFDALSAASKTGIEVEPLKEGRFLFINAWRNIAETPIEDNHLALCDETSLVKPDDYIPYDYFEDGYDGTHYFLSSRNVQHHRWYYFPRMVKDEVILFKQYDSDPLRKGRMCFHSAFSDPTAPPEGTNPRESIEVRCVAFFPDHVPNTCPSPDGPIRVACSAILQQIEFVHEWPLAARWWFQDLVKRDKLGSLLDTMIEDRDNVAGIKGADRQLKEAVRSKVLDAGFESCCRKSYSLLKGTSSK